MYQSAKLKKDGTTEVRQENTSTGFISSEVHMELTPSNIRELNDVTM